MNSQEALQVIGARDDRLISDNEVAKETGQEEILLCTAFQRQSVFLRIVNDRDLP